MKLIPPVYQNPGNLEFTGADTTMDPVDSDAPARCDMQDMSYYNEVARLTKLGAEEKEEVCCRTARGLIN